MDQILGSRPISPNGEPQPVPDGYMGLEWDSNWWFFNYDTLSGIEPQSSPNAAGVHQDGWNVLQAEASVSFSSVNADPFAGGFLAGDTDVEVMLIGWLGSTVVGTSKPLTLSASPTFLAADFPGPVDKVVVHAERQVTGSAFFIDDIVYTLDIPEPSTLVLTVLGLLGMGWYGWRGWRS